MTRPPSFTKANRYDMLCDHGAIVLCQICGDALYVGTEVGDHHLAWIDGGMHERENWRPTCFGCNSRKGVIEHKNNAKAKRLAHKNSGQESKPKRREWPLRQLRGKSSWPESRPMQSRPFQKRNQEVAK